MSDGNRPTTHQAEAAAVAEIMRDSVNPEVITIESPEKSGKAARVIVTPDGDGGFRITDTKAYTDPLRETPARRTGSATLLSLDSLIDHCNRFKNDHSALFANDDRNSPSLTAVLNYHDAGADGSPQFGDHRGVYRFPLSDEWNAWTNSDGQALEQIDFAEFLETRITDVMPPPDFLTDKNVAPEGDSEKALADLVEKIGGKACGPGKLMELSKGLRVHDNQTAEEVHHLSSGETRLRFKSEHTGEDGKPINIPNLFLIAIPVFNKGPLYRVPVRLRYRLRGGKIVWILALHRPDAIQDHALAEAWERAKTETALPLFMGTPE